MEDWKKRALEEETNPHYRDIIINGPRGLSAHWYYRHMYRKYK